MSIFVQEYNNYCKNQLTDISFPNILDKKKYKCILMTHK